MESSEDDNAPNSNVCGCNRWTINLNLPERASIRNLGVPTHSGEVASQYLRQTKHINPHG
jgi:hypothetical protein